MAQVEVTDAAFDQLQSILEREGKDLKLRVAVLGGGCSGFQYSFELEQQQADDDLVVERDGIAVLVDPISLPFLDGAVIDYRRELIGSRFLVDNPNAQSSCGCGTSFSM